MTPQRGVSDCTSADELQDFSNIFKLNTAKQQPDFTDLSHSVYVTNSHVFNNGTGRTSGKIVGVAKKSNIGGV